MSKAALYAINNTQQTLTGGGSVDLGNPVHGFGQCRLSGIHTVHE